MSVKEFVDATIGSKPVVIFSKSYCPYCVKAKNLFKDEIKVRSDKIEIIEIEDRPDCADIQAYLKELTGASSVPRVFINKESIGGCDDTFKLHNSGELTKTLSALGAV